MPPNCKRFTWKITTPSSNNLMFHNLIDVKLLHKLLTRASILMKYMCTVCTRSIYYSRNSYIKLRYRDAHVFSNNYHSYMKVNMSLFNKNEIKIISLAEKKYHSLLERNITLTWNKYHTCKNKYHTFLKEI